MRLGLVGPTILASALVVFAASHSAWAEPSEQDVPRPSAAPVEKAPDGSENQEPKKASDLVDQAYKAWKDWEPHLARMTQRFQKDYEDYNKWDYEALAVGSLDARTLVESMNEMGEQGWECFGTVALVEGQHLLFRRRKECLLTRFPMRETLRVLFEQLMTTESQEP